MITKANSSIKLAVQSKVYNGKTQSYSGKVTRNGSTGKITYTYYSDAEGTKVVKPLYVKAAKTYYVRATLAANANYKAAKSALVKFTITKAVNPMTVSAKSTTVKYATVSNKNLKVTCLTVAKNQGTKTYTLSSINKIKFKKYFAVNSKTGTLTVMKGVPKGSYIIEVSVKAAGNTNYKAVTKKVKFTITVK